MPKLPIVLAGVGAVVVVGGAAIVLTQKDSSDTKQSSTSSSSSTKEASGAKVNDPQGTYAFFSDPSVTKYPAKNAVFGNGQTLTFEYDGSKTNNDEYATLSYQLYYIQDNGGVIAMGGGNIEGKGGKGTFTMNNKVYTSNADGRQGFLELTGTTTAGTSGTNIKLGMYPVKFQISK